jgi:hypothetical protein
MGLITGCILKSLLLVSEFLDNCQQLFTWLDMSGLKSVWGISTFDVGQLTPVLATVSTAALPAMPTYVAGNPKKSDSAIKM